jgi:DNA-binding response OmpR family regulator
MKRVLIVEDNDLVREMLSVIVEHLDESIEIDSVESAEEAPDIFEPNKYILVITDISLIKMNGLELCLKLRKKDKIVKIVGISGYNSLLDMNNLAIAGFDSWFTKPDGYKKFIIEVEKIIKGIDK